MEPQPALASAKVDGRLQIEMSQQEIAVALSHIRVWRRVARGEPVYALVLEDDVYFTREFAPVFDQAWADLVYNVAERGNIDLVYLSYEEAKGGAEKEHVSEYLFRPTRGLWNLSGYVVSKEAAKKLLALLPVRGPVDLWLNHQFHAMNVFATSTSLIEQRRDYRSENSYSILPTLAKLGILSQETSSTPERRAVDAPIIGLGQRGGLTSLAMALSMLGYRCCSDVDELPREEHEKLFGGRKGRVFDAYVNVGSVEVRWIELVKIFPECRVIIVGGDKGEVTENCLERWEGGSNAGMGAGNGDGTLTTWGLAGELQKRSVRYLTLTSTDGNMWKALCQFLGCDPPASAYPKMPDRPQRRLVEQTSRKRGRRNGVKKLRFDRSPWIVPLAGNWSGVPVEELGGESCEVVVRENPGDWATDVGKRGWRLLDDTFPSNLALFRPENVSIERADCAALVLRKEESYVREYTSAAIGSQKSYLYGRFEAVIRPARVPGVITGLFLHRNSPRQEIDMEFLGKDTKKLLVNVYYNPGAEGAKLDYGFRGAPALVNLGFDASEDFHRYAIEWFGAAIRWLVDGRVVHERANWEPTPIPHLPMQFYINLWASRSRELTGRLLDDKLPAHSEIRSIELQACA